MGIETVGFFGATGPLVSWADSNGVSFGIAGNTVTMSATASQADGAQMVVGTDTVASGYILFSESNSLTFGMPDGTNLSASLSGWTGVYAGTNTLNGGEVSFANSHEFTFGMSGSVTITASVTLASLASLGIGTIHGFWDVGISNAASATSSWDSTRTNIITLMPVSIPGNFTATQGVFFANVAPPTITGVSTFGATWTLGHAVYSINGTSASLLSSAQRQLTADTANSGLGYRSMSMNYAFTPGEYLFAYSWSHANSTNGTRTKYIEAWLHQGANWWASVTNTTINNYNLSTVFAPGMLTAGSFPAAISVTQTGYSRAQTGAQQLLFPAMIFAG